MILNYNKFDLWGRKLIEKVRIKAPYRLSIDFPDQACFIYYEKGRAIINSPSEQVLVKSDESVILNCGTYFADLLEYTDGDFYDILVIHLHPDTLKRLYKDEFPGFMKKQDGSKYIRKIAPQEIIKKFVENLYFYFENPSVVNDEILQLKVKELILLLVQSKNAASIVDLLADLFASRDISIKEIVHQHLLSNIAVKDLAVLSNMTLVTFNRKFREQFKDTPANYIKTKRLERAKELLQISNLSISEVAFQTCFNDIAHFSRSFKHLFNISPSAFRASVK